MRVWISTAFFLLCLSSLPGQQFYFRMGGGYGWAASGESQGAISITTLNSADDKAVIGSNGVGAMPFATVGYRFHDFMSFQLEGEFVAGKKETKLTLVQPLTSSMTSERSQQIRLIPTLVLGNNDHRINPYLKLGMSLPIWTITEVELITEDYFVPETFIRYVSELKGKPLLGFNGGLGVSFAVTDLLGITLEAGAISQRLKAKSGKAVFFEVNGVDQIPDLQPYALDWNYLESLDSDDNSRQIGLVFDPNQPEDRLQISQNFSSFFVKLGLQISLPTSGN